MKVRPALRPGLRLSWRGPTALQVGVAPGPAVVLSGVRAGDEAVVAAMDGTRDTAQLEALARRHGLGAGRVAELVQLLTRAGLLMGADRERVADRVHLSRLGAAARARLTPDTDALSLVHGEDGVRLAADRARRHVRVEGAGRVGALVATTLGAAGVGTVHLVDPRPVRPGDVVPGGASHADVGGGWPRVASAAVARTTSTAGPAPVQHGPPGAGDAAVPPDVAVLVGEHVLDPRAGAALVRRDVAHLGVLVATDRVVVGPMVLPGSSACLHCLDLHRRDRDPLWLHVMAQLLLLAPRSASPVGETALATMAAGLAALQVLTLLDGQVEPDTVGRTLELSLPHGVVRRRSWSPHPACGCSRLTGERLAGPAGAARAGRLSNGAVERAPSQGQTMGS
ncbi:MAG TPA: TOMM precursor leader peptide-binding protein [Actinomycetales bacterium]